MADIMIRVDHVTMDFRMDVNRTTNLKEWVMNALQGKRKIEHFRALDDVCFTVERGEEHHPQGDQRHLQAHLRRGVHPGPGGAHAGAGLRL